MHRSRLGSHPRTVSDVTLLLVAALAMPTWVQSAAASRQEVLRRARADKAAALDAYAPGRLERWLSSVAPRSVTRYRSRGPECVARGSRVEPDTCRDLLLSAVRCREGHGPPARTERREPLTRVGEWPIGMNPAHR